MSNRILVWHFGESEQPVFYMEKDYTPTAVRLYARNAPKGGDLEVDIRDDGSTIFGNRVSVVVTTTVVYSEISYNTLVGAFTIGEKITGATSGATGRVVSDKLGNMALTLIATTAFTVGETISGASSSATAVVLNFYRGGNPIIYSQDSPKATAILSKGDNLNEMAEDFLPATPPIEVGSIVTCHLIETNGASDITVQLELESLDEEGEISE